MAQQTNKARLESLVQNAPHDNPALTVLSDHEIIDLLENVTKEEVLEMQQALRTSLHEYSTAKQDNPACQKNQQERMVGTSRGAILQDLFCTLERLLTYMQVIEHPNGTTTLIMPAQSSSGMSMKGGCYHVYSTYFRRVC
jgi:hypothetical protein